MIDSGSFSIVIKGDHLDFNDINTSLAISPSKTFRKGETSSEIVGRNTNDVWIYEVKFSNIDELNKTIENVLLRIEAGSKCLQELTCNSNVLFKCYVQSDYAQINFELQPHVLEKLAKLKVRLVFSILSWGNVKDTE